MPPLRERSSNVEFQCDECWYNCYDEEEEVYYCEKDVDEDEYARVMTGRRRCPYFIKADDYFISRHQ